ncbi:MAG: hypothetical protein P8K10_07445 [Crocinitomicaceae bacterium]|nr:hypothetical protein [Crocinitomicaceae bacterium]
MFSLLFIGLSSCSNEISDDLLDYINKYIPKIADKEAKALDLYESVRGENYTDDETMYYTIKNEVIPAYRDFIDELEPISGKLKTAEVREVHEKYIEAANTQFTGFMLILSALENQDFNEMAKANEKLDKGKKLLREYQTELEKLCEENHVTFETN